MKIWDVRVSWDIGGATYRVLEVLIIADTEAEAKDKAEYRSRLSWNEADFSATLLSEDDFPFEYNYREY